MGGLRMTYWKPIQDFQKQVHAILGTFVYVQMALQVASGIARPPLSSERRRPWNMLHATNGICIYIGCCMFAVIGADHPF